MKDRYLKILSEVKQWEVPSDKHKGLKKFAIQQLEDSMNADCDTSYYDNQVIKMESIKEYRQKQIDRYEQDVKYYTEHNQGEIDSTNERNLWIKQLRDSLK